MANVPETIEREMKELISGISGLDIKEIKSEASFEQDLNIDSIKAIEITVAIEKKYKIRIKDEQVAQITTVAKAMEVVKEALGREE